MSIPFTCPHCGAQTNVDDRFAGQSGPCFQCGKTVAIPAPAGGAAPSADPFAAYPTAAAPPRKSNGMTWVIVAAIAAIPMLLCVVGILIALLLPAVQAAREAARRSTCRNNLKELGLALHLYHETHGSLPPPYLADADGTPMHSWRVLLLPYLDGADLYARYDFNEPWDGPNNRQLAADMPKVFQCPSVTGSSGAETTNYVAVVGPGFLFEADKANRFVDILDGTSNTIALVESSGPLGAGVHWMSPEDLSADSVNSMINGQPGPAIASEHAQGVNLLMADGSVHFVNENLPTDVLRGMLTKDGREASLPLQ